MYNKMDRIMSECFVRVEEGNEAECLKLNCLHNENDHTNTHIRTDMSAKFEDVWKLLKILKISVRYIATPLLTWKPNC